MPKKKTPVATKVRKIAPKKTAAGVRRKKAIPKKIKKKTFRPWLFVIIGAVVLLFIYSLFIVHCSFIHSVVPVDKTYTIAPGASVSSVARDLNQGGAYRFFIKHLGNKVIAGTYDLPAGTSVWRLAEMTAKGEVARTTVMIPEGMTVKQIAILLDNNENLSGEIKNQYKDGELFPDTYIVAKGTNRQAVLDLMAKKMAQIKFQMANAAVPRPLKDWNEVVTLASIVQKETPKVVEMPTVASVYLNRLRVRMRLQADPTVVYVITDHLGDMREQRLYTKHLWVQSPYNTYRNHGLPPAPIANPGLDAIRAVLNPADTDYYYFVADGDGGHNFSKTLDEHNRHRANWQEIRKSR